MNKFLDVIIPRFITEWVVLVDDGNAYEPICNVDDLQDFEFFPAMRFQKWKVFNFFGYALFPQAVGSVYKLDSYSEIENLDKL